MRKIAKNCLSLVMAFSLVYSPIAIQNAIADDLQTELDTVCKKSLEDAQNKKSTQGDQTMAYCVQADIARQSKEVEATKSIIYLSAAVVATGATVLEMSVVPATVALGKTICTATSIGATAAGIGYDIYGKTIINDTKEKYNQARDQSLDVMSFMPLVTSLTPLLTSEGTKVATEVGTKAAEKGASKWLGCAISAIMLGLEGGTSSMSSSNLEKAEAKAIEDAKSIQNAVNGSVTAFAQVNPTQQDLAKPPTSTGIASNKSASIDSCANKNGNQYLSCVGNVSPEVAALSNSPEFLSQMQKSLHGKNLGDFVKGYKGNSNADLASYVASGLQVSPSLVEAVMKNNDKLAQAAGDKFRPMGYARSTGAKPSLGGEDLDFGKMMSGLMGKLNPTADGKKEKTDPSELVFRQLELLPADKIQANRDISLFARVAYRYRKNASNVDQVRSEK